MTATRPEIVFHLAAQALVRASLADPVGTFDVNVSGTAALLDVACAQPTVRVVVVVTSDKVYANEEVGRPFVESDKTRRRRSPAHRRRPPSWNNRFVASQLRKVKAIRRW